MKIHIITSPELSPALFTKTIELLSAIQGAISFSFDKEAVLNFDLDEIAQYTFPDVEDFETSISEKVIAKRHICESITFPYTQQEASWDTLFKKCASYRHQRRIPNDEFVVLLTTMANDKNWFAALDEKMPYNGFIHTDDWSHYIDCPAEFPIAYEVIALMLQKFMFSGMYDVRTSVHTTPVGCVNDMCIQKREIILKLRTADICRSCMDRIKDKLPAPAIHHALQIMESLRVKMLYAQNFKQESPLSNLILTPHHKLFLPEFGQIEIKLRPLEKALYYLFLDHPEGIFLSSLSDYRQDLYTIYSRLSNTGMLQEMKGRIDDMTNALNNSASEKISRIKRVFEEAVGHELAKNYYICGQVGEVKKISLPREKVIDQRQASA
jgi:hypothetical protein